MNHSHLAIINYSPYRIKFSSKIASAGFFWKLS